MSAFDTSTGHNASYESCTDFFGHWMGSRFLPESDRKERKGAQNKAKKSQMLVVRHVTRSENI